MRRFCYTLSAIIITAFISMPAFTEEPRLPDVDRIMKIISEIPAYKPYLVPGTDQEATNDQFISNATEIFLTKDHFAYGNFHLQTSIIDSIEEYCLAAFLMGKKLPYPKLQRAFDEEFPKNNEGWLRMAALWYKTYSIDTNYNESAKDALPIIIKQAAKNGIAITEESARAYYEKAVRNSLNSAFSSELAKGGFKTDPGSLEKITAPWYEYFTSPSDDSYSVISIGRNCVEDASKSSKAKSGLIQAYDNAVMKFGGEAFFTQWNYRSARSYFYEEDIERIYNNYFADIPLFRK